MNREILFRGKRIDNGEWVEGAFLNDAECWGRPDFHTYIVNHKCPSGCFGRDIYIEVDPATVGQYTGLKDKNGQRIFEGDIVKESFEGTSTEYAGDWSEYKYEVDFYGYKIGTIVFSGTGTHLKASMGELWIDGENQEYTPARRTRLAAYRCEVIGNIHDNLELLKGGDHDN